MARKEEIILVCDMTGEPSAATISFGLDRDLYEIELTASEEEKLRDALAPYTERGRKVGRYATRPAARITRQSKSGSAAARLHSAPITSVPPIPDPAFTEPAVATPAPAKDLAEDTVINRTRGARTRRQLTSTDLDAARKHAVRVWAARMFAATKDPVYKCAERGRLAQPLIDLWQAHVEEEAEKKRLTAAATG